MRVALDALVQVADRGAFLRRRRALEEHVQVNVEEMRTEERGAVEPNGGEVVAEEVDEAVAQARGGPTDRFGDVIQRLHLYTASE